MKVLFIGGTGIISEAASKQAVRQGIDLYLLNRDKTPNLYPKVQNLLKPISGIKHLSIRL